MRDTFKPLFDRYKVDLVLQGHDHTYARGMSKIPMQRKGDRSGTVYVVSVSGPKMASSGVAPKSWMDRSALNTQLYNVISILDDKLEFRAYTVTGKLFDAFDLLKQNGSINKLVEKMPVLAN
jgi:3',5'-cyclic AMP phosphodiesterase CpdA